ncbi:MAG: 50S ribosomal protein L11 methyltransferase [Acidilobaceae archaeon]
MELDECVYKPSDDTELAAEALLNLSREGRTYSSIIEIGSGSGVLALLAYKLFKPSKLIATDISPYATRLSRKNLPEEVLVVRCDGATCFRDGWDLAILNPPYLPVKPRSPLPEGCEDWLDLAWSGMEDMERLVREALRISRETLVVSSSLSPISVETIALEEKRRARLLISKRFFFEEIYVYYIEST